MKNTIVTTFILLSIINLNRQNNSDLRKYIPKDYKIMKLVEYDLDNDQDLDVVMVLNHKNDSLTEMNSIDSKRQLIVLRRNPSLDLWSKNDEVIFCFDCGGIFGDPFEGIDLKPGRITINHYGGSNWRWNHNLTFKLSENDEWILEKITNNSYHVFNVDSSFTTTVKTIQDFGLIKLSEFKDEDH